VRSEDLGSGMRRVAVEAPDRVGLLWDLSRALTVAGCDLSAARITTRGRGVRDVFTVTVPDELTDEALLEVVRAAADPAAAP